MTELDQDALWNSINPFGSGPMYWDREGNPMNMRDWSRRMNDWDYKVIDRQYFFGTFISTVWLGLNHGFGLGAPLIYETMAFERPSQRSLGRELFCDRYSTEEQARRGQRRVYWRFARWHYAAVAAAFALVFAAMITIGVAV